MDRVSQHLGRTALAGLAFVAASYHLTDLARRQAELVRQRQAQHDRSKTATSDDPDNSSDPQQVIAWFAPDMLDRACLRNADGVERKQPVECNHDTITCWNGPARTGLDAGSAVSRSARPACPDSTRVSLSDRSPHGPPSSC